MNISEEIFIVEQILLPPDGALKANILPNFTNISSAAENGVQPVSASLACTRFVVQTVITPIVVSVGLLGNVLNILVLMQPSMRTSTNVYLLALAIADSAYLIFSFTLSFVGCGRRGLSYAAYAFNTYGRTISDMAGNIAVWIIVIFTVERYVAVCHPLYGKVWCTVRRARMFSLVAAFLCVVNTAPGFFELEVVLTQDGPRCRYTPFTSTPAYELGYTWWYVTIFTFLPFTFLLIFNSLLIHTLVGAARHRQGMQSHGARPDNSEVSATSSQCRCLPGRDTAQCLESGDSGCYPSCWPLAKSAPCSAQTAVDSASVQRVDKANEAVHQDGNLTLTHCKTERWLQHLADGSNKLCRADTLSRTGSQSLKVATRHETNREKNSFQPEDCPVHHLPENGRSNPPSSHRHCEAERLDPQRGLMMKDDRASPVTNTMSTATRSLSSPLQASPAHSYARSSPSLSPKCPHRLRLSRRSQEQYKVTLMLTVIVIIFLLCQLPWTVLYLHRAYLSAHNLSAAGSEAIKIAGNVANLLVQVNASGNFYLYSFFSRRFRMTLARLFLFWKKDLSQSSFHL